MKLARLVKESMRHAEERLKLLGCPKINLQILHGNEAVEAFYRKLGYQTEPRISMGKKIIENTPSAEPGACPNEALPRSLPIRVSRRGRHRRAER